MRSATTKQASSNKSQTPALPAVPAKPYELTEREHAAVENLKTRRGASKPAPRLKMATSPNGLLMSLDHPDSRIGSGLLQEALGVADHDALMGLLDQIVNFSTTGKQPNEAAINSALAMVKGIEPRDTVEAMLAVQMAAVHFATMTFARRLNQIENIQQQDSAANAFNKLARTFTTQMEALNRHRGKGEQKMTVEHVHVHAGGQAIVTGNVQGGGH